MRSRTTRSVHRPPALALLAACALVLVLVALPAHVEAADYTVVGRVYSASPLDAGEEPEGDPLAGKPAEQVVGDGLVASVPRNLVRVRLLAAADGTELASYITQKDGGYLATFSAPAGGVSVRFVVDELATSQQVLDSEPQDLSAGVSVRYLLVPEVPTEIAGDLPEEPVAPPGFDYTGIFTRVGKIEVSTEVSGSTTELISSTDGTATVPSTVAGQLAIPPYQDAPFGGNLFLFGAFSHDLYASDACYKIRIYDDPAAPSTAPHTYLDQPLVKTRYTVSFSTGSVDTERVTLGPKSMNGTTNCYRFTPVAASNNVFWSFPDLLALWRTAGLNGDYRLELELVQPSPPLPGTFGLVDQSDLTLMLDNVAPVAQIQPLWEASGGLSEAGDTPRVYTPGPVPSGFDLMAGTGPDNLPPLGNVPNSYGGEAAPTCGILSLDSQPSTQYLTFKLTASHSAGYLRYWDFRWWRNDKNSEVVLGKRYDGTGMVDQAGVRVSSSQASESGFEGMFLYLDSDHLEASGASLGGCGYEFTVRAGTRTTDGYHYLRHARDEDVHYIQK